MDLLLDTHTLIWFLNGNETSLSVKAKQLIAEPANRSYVSVASLWEMAIKIRLGSLSFEPGYDNLLTLLEENGFNFQSPFNILGSCLRYRCIIAIRSTVY